MPGGHDILLLGYDSDNNLSIRSLAAFLLEHGIRIEIDTCESSRKEAILQKILRGNPKIVGFSIAFQSMLDEFSEVIGYLRRNGIRAHFTAGGHIPTIASKGIFEIVPGLDSAVRHEGEYTLLELYQNLDTPDLWPAIRGLVWPRGGVIHAAPPRPLIADLDSLPFPSRCESFQTSWQQKVCSIVASRGCNYNCSFCSIRQYYSDAVGRRHRMRSPSSVAQEMEQLFQKGVRIFIFEDDDLGTRRESERIWMEQFAQQLETRGLADNILWSMFSRADEVDADLLSRLKQCGLAYLCMGIESGNKQGLRTFNKGFDVGDVFRAVEILQRIGLFFEYGFMMFDPGSTFQSIRTNVEFLERLCQNGQVPVRFTKMVPLMGTPIARSLRETGRLKGTVAVPTYSFIDNRLDLLELCWARAFGPIAFNPKGLVDRLRRAKTDAVVVGKFRPKSCDVTAFAASVKKLIVAFNESAFETMRKSLEFMASRSYEDILYYWDLLDMLCEQELETQQQIATALDKLIFANPEDCGIGLPPREEVMLLI